MIFDVDYFNFTDDEPVLETYVEAESREDAVRRAAEKQSELEAKYGPLSFKIRLRSTG